MEIVPNQVFPSVVWTTLFDDRDAFNRALVKRVYELQEDDPKGVENTNINGWQSKNTIQVTPGFEDISLRMVQVCQRIGESLYFLPGVSYKLQAWANINPPGASNSVHYHANCHFSGIYYVSLKAPSCGNVFFRDPRVASRMLTAPTSRPSEFTAEEVRMKPEEGRMYIFPGWLEHGVESNQSGQDRVSIAFNALAAVPEER